MSAAALERVITAMAGPDARPRPDQITAVEALAEYRRRVLVVQATGWGKSAVYWAATAALRAAGGGPTLVVSPLLALMRDQIAAAGRAGLRAATVNSTNVDDWDEVLTEMGAGRLDVLLISPERLSNPAFAPQFGAMTRNTQGLIEAAAGDLPRARRYHEEAMRIAIGSRDAPVVAMCLVGVADLVLREGDPERAAYLLGGADAVRGSTDRTVHDAADVEREARAALGDAGFEAAYCRGSDVIVANALEAAGL